MDKGRKKPTAKQLVKLSQYTHIPIGYLMLPRVKDEKVPLIDYRTVDSEKLSQPSRELIDVIQDMERKQSWMREFLQNTNSAPLPYFNSLDIHMSKMTAAKRIREVLNLNKKWYEKFYNPYTSYTFLKKQIQTIRILVFQDGTALGNPHRSLDLQEFRAFTLVDPFASLIFINGKDSYNGKIFSLVHELVHIFIGENSLYNEELDNNEFHHKDVEKFCNEVTAEIVTPKSEIQKQWKSATGSTLVKIEELSIFFNINKWVIARRV